MEEKNNLLNENLEEKQSKLGKLIVPIIVVIILAAFAGVIYYSKAIKPNADIDKKAGFTAEDYIKLGKYSGFSKTITQKAFDDSVHEETDEYETVSRAAKDTDHVDVSVVATIDGKKVDDLKQDTIELAIGSDKSGLFKKMSDAVKGHKDKDTVKVKVPGSEVSKISKSKKTYDGTVTLQIKIAEVNQLNREKVTDKWVKDTYEEDYGYTTVKDFYDFIEESLTTDVKSDFWAQAVESATMNGWPSELYKSVVDEFTADANYEADQWNMSYKEYIYDFQQYTDETLEEEYKNEVKSALVMWAMVKKLDLTITDEEIENKYEELYESTDDYKSVDEVKKDYKKSEIEEAVYLDKAQQYVFKHSKLVKKYKRPDK